MFSNIEAPTRPGKILFAFQTNTFCNSDISVFPTETRSKWYMQAAGDVELLSGNDGVKTRHLVSVSEYLF